MESDHAFDLVIVGSGGGSFCAALAARAAGCSVVILEKQGVVGGSTAFSGGQLWLPNNPLLGDRDSFEKARHHLDMLIGDPLPSSTPARRDAFVREGRAMVGFLQGLGMRFKDSHWPDYYSDAPGGLAEGRSLTVEKFNLAKLGEWRPRLAQFPIFALPLGAEEASAMSLARRTSKGALAAAKFAVRMLLEKLTGRPVRGSGQAVQGRMLQLALRHDVPIWTECSVIDLLEENGRIVGVLAERDGRRIAIGASGGVLLDAGGFARNDAMRQQHGPKPTGTAWTVANAGDTGEVMKMAVARGAATDLMNEAIWTPSSFLPDGTIAGFHVPGDVGKPHCLVVGADGRRFTNEACSYMEFGQRMYAAGAVPAFAILESRHRARYPFGMRLLPGHTPADLLAAGYVVKAGSLEELAVSCGIDAVGLRATVDRFNGFCDTGIDEDFGRGSSAYNRYSGDPRVKPNACLGRIERAPFYAVRMLPADVGTSGGLVTDEHARVLRSDGSPIDGLYATGAITASVFGRCYPGAGASIGPAFVFGYIAARHALRVNDYCSVLATG